MAETEIGGEFFGIQLNWVEEHIGAASVWGLLATIAATFISIYTIVGHLRYYGQPHLQRYIVRILVVIPVYSIASWISLITFRHSHSTALYVDLIRDGYEAFVLYSFFILILTFAGGESTCVAKMQPKQDLRHPWPCCFLARIPRTAGFLRRCRQSMLQFAFLKPLLSICSLLMLACNAYDSVAYQWILALLYNASYSVALYGLLLFYMATKEVISTFKPVQKFISIKLIIFMTFWQSSLMNLIPGISESQATGWKDFILCLEMPVFAFLLLQAFGARSFQEECDRLTAEEAIQHMKEVLNVGDMVIDAYHNFTPTYKQYVQQGLDDEYFDESNHNIHMFEDSDSPEDNPMDPTLQNAPALTRPKNRQENDQQGTNIVTQLADAGSNIVSFFNRSYRSTSSGADAVAPIESLSLQDVERQVDSTFDIQLVAIDGEANMRHSM